MIPYLFPVNGERHSDFGSLFWVGRTRDYDEFVWALLACGLITRTAPLRREQ
jgi:hypothetical protein